MSVCLQQLAVILSLIFLSLLCSGQILSPVQPGPELFCYYFSQIRLEGDHKTPYKAEQNKAGRR